MIFFYNRSIMLFTMAQKHSLFRWLPRSIRLLAAPFLLNAAIFGAASAQGDYLVATSIRPLAGIASAITAGSTVDVAPIIDPADSLLPDPDTGPKPVYINRVRRANLTVLISRHYERALDEAIGEYAEGKSVEVGNLPNIDRVHKRRFNIVRIDDKGVIVTPDNFPTGDQTDYHLWLDPKIALKIAAGLRDRLSKARPQEAEMFAANYDAFASRVMEAGKHAMTTLLPLTHQSYIAMTDKYQYFDRSFLLHQAAIVQNGDTPPDEDRIGQIAGVMSERGSTCLVTSPGDDDDAVKAISKAGKVEPVAIDPMGGNIPLGPDYYPSLLTGMADQFARCLRAPQTLHQ